MPATVIVGGQYGSEGKGKVAHWWAEQPNARAAIRVGGPNSGHTVVDGSRRLVLRQIPTAALIPGMLSLLGPGSYVDPEVLLAEIRLLGVTPNELAIDPSAVVVTEDNKTAEANAGLLGRIGSTLSGTGGAVLSRAARDGSVRFVSDVKAIAPFVRQTYPIVRMLLDQGSRVIAEGTQGFGLSVLHSPEYPFVTARDTTAAAVASEAGLSPLDIDEVVMVIRSFPIRVGGHSGHLENETDWQSITNDGHHDHGIDEFTSVTKRLRRVARFDASIVRRALAINNPTYVVLNHMDYVDHECCVTGELSSRAEAFLRQVEEELERRIDFIGLGADVLLKRTVDDHLRVNDRARA
jgi:adenylosuccinate synthase